MSLLAKSMRLYPVLVLTVRYAYRMAYYKCLEERVQRLVKAGREVISELTARLSTVYALMYIDLLQSSATSTSAETRSTILTQRNQWKRTTSRHSNHIQHEDGSTSSSLPQASSSTSAGNFIPRDGRCIPAGIP